MSAEPGLLMTLESLRPWLALPGLGLIVFALLDLLTTSVMSGEGPLTRLIYRSACRALQRLSQGLGKRELLSWMAVWMVLGTFISWFTLTWAGWTLLFWSQPGVVVWAGDDQVANLLDTAYFVGYTLTTLGLGDLHATAPGWRLATSLAALNGFFY